MASAAVWPDDPLAAARAEALLTRYGLTGLPQRASTQRVLENLTYLQWLNAFVETAPQTFALLFESLKTEPCLNWLDAGAKNWAYVDALDGFIRAHFRGAYRLDGVELDPHRRYRDFTTRSQAAEAYIKALPQAQYHGMDLMDWRRKAHIITHFLPFLGADPHLGWGLPLNRFQPEALLLHLLHLLEPGGILLIVNQGEWEAEAQEALLNQAATQIPLRVQGLGVLPTEWMRYRYPRYGWLCMKQAV